MLGSSEADAKMELGAICLLGIHTKRKEKEEELAGQVKTPPKF